MSLTNTQECRDFLDKELNLSSAKWKRVSKKKKETGEYVRIFECIKNNLRAEVYRSFKPGVTCHLH